VGSNGHFAKGECEIELGKNEVVFDGSVVSDELLVFFAKVHQTLLAPKASEVATQLAVFAAQPAVCRRQGSRL